jgi:hypothetical protein
MNNALQIILAAFACIAGLVIVLSFIGMFTIDSYEPPKPPKPKKQKSSKPIVSVFPTARVIERKDRR